MKKLTPLEEFIFTFTMEEADILLVVMTQQGVIEKASKSAERLVGSDLQGVSFTKMLIDFHGNYKLEELLAPKEELQLLNIVNKQGLPLTYYFRFEQFEDKIVGIGQQDASEIDEMRRNLLSLNNDLNNLTRELHKKNVQLEQLDAQKNQFFGMASHDLRHPLGVINMYSQFLEMEAAESLSVEHQEFLSYIRTSSHLMEEILNNFLDFAIFESGRLELHCEKLELNKFLAKIVQYTAPLARRKEIHLHFLPAQSPVSLMVDKAKMEQVINNLLSNGIKYTQAGGEVVLEVSGSATEVVIRVRDNGLGIKEEDLERLFLPFERIDSGGKDEEKSSGLGLAIVKKIIDAHGGKIWAESALGEGTTFSVALPVN